MKPRVGLLGAGIMGAGMAERLLEQGFAVDVWDRTPAIAANLAQRGATAHAQVPEAVRSTDLVITMLATADAVADVMLQQGGLAAVRPDGVWVQMATIGLDATETLIAQVSTRRSDVAFVDAPVSGTRDPARNGQLTILASGPDRAQGILAPVFQALGQHVLWLGAPGQGTRMKLVLNTWLAFDVEAAAEVSAVAHHLGVPYGSLLEAVQGGPLVSGAALARLAKMEASDHSPQFPLEWALKDLDLVAAAAGTGSAPVARAIADRWRDLVRTGFGRLDASAARLGLDGEGDGQSA